MACSSEVLRLDPTGVVLQTYSGASLGEPSTATLTSAVQLFSLALDSDGSSFWVGDENYPSALLGAPVGISTLATTGNLNKVDINSGTVLTHQVLPYGIGGITVAGAPAPGLPVGGPPIGGPIELTSTLGNGGGAQNNTQCRATGNPVNCATGNFYHTFNDIQIPGRGPALDLTRTYNSLAAGTSGAFGYGWASSYTANLTTDVTSGAVTVHQEDGATVTFAAQAGGGYSAAPRVLASLVKNADGTFTFTRRQRQRLGFSASGQLLTEADLNGYTTYLAYNTAGQLISVTDASGRALTLLYGSNGHVSQVSDPTGRHLSYSYDAANNLTDVIDVAGGHTGFTYDANHLALTMSDPRAGTVHNYYDSGGRVTRQTDAMGRATGFVYTSTGSTITDPNGDVTVETYSYGELISATKGFGTPYASTWNYRYDPATLGLTWSQDPNGHTRVATYDANGNPLSTTDPLRRKTTFTYDGLNDLTSTTDPAGETTTTTYDAHGNLLTRSRPLAGSNAVQKIAIGYGDPAHPGDPTASTDPNGHSSSFTHNANGDLVSNIDPDGNRTTVAYDQIGRTTSMTSPRGNAAGANPASFTTTYQYDSFGDITLTTDPLGHITARSYDADRNLISTTDPNGHTTSYTYDPDNEMTRTQQADGTTLSTTYDADGNIAAQTDPLGHAAIYRWDAQNRLLATADALGRQITYLDDPAGNRVSSLDQTGQTTTYGYDPANQLVSTRYSDGKTPNVAYGYDADGRRTAMVDGTGTTHYTYDSLGRLTANTDGAGRQVGYSYDISGQLTSIRYPTPPVNLSATTTLNLSGTPAGVVNATRQYDPAGRVTSISDGLGNTTGFNHDPDGNLITQSYPNAITSALSYDAADHLARTTDTLPGGVPFLDFPYNRDPAGQITTANAAPTPAQVTQTYGYDNLNRLTSAAVPTPATTIPTNNYNYDNADRLTQIANGTLPTTLAYDNADQLTAATTVGQTTTYSYDAKGNRTAATANTANATYTWDQANRLTGYAGPAIHAINSQAGTNIQANYTYNGDGLRADLVWDLAEGLPLIIADSNKTAYITGPNQLPLEEITSQAVAYYHHDQLGSTRALTSEAGQPLISYTYDPYGNTTPSNTTIANPFQYAGQYCDPETGLIYLRARYYDPATAQFLTRDPLDPLTRSAYGYVGGNPLNGTDPTGLGCGLFDPGGCISAVANTASNLYQDYQAGGGASASGHILAVEGAVVGGAALVATTGGAGLVALGEAAAVAGDSAILTSVLAVVGESAVAGGTQLALAAAGVSAVSAGFDCSRAVDLRCLGDIAATLGGLVTAGGGFVVGQTEGEIGRAAGVLLAELGFKFSVAPLLNGCK